MSLAPAVGGIRGGRRLTYTRFRGGVIDGSGWAPPLAGGSPEGMVAVVASKLLLRVHGRYATMYAAKRCCGAWA